MRDRPASSNRESTIAALGDALRKVSGQSVLFSHAVAEAVGIHSTDLECLDIIYWKRGPISAGELASASGLTTGAITGVIDRLERQGYVRREADPHDRRRVIVRLEQERIDCQISPMFDYLGEQMVQLCSAYSDDELALLVDFTRRGYELTLEATRRVRNIARGRPDEEGADP